MNVFISTLGKLCEFIKIELRGLYPDPEISSLTDIIISHLFEIPKHEIHIKKDEPVSERDSTRFINIVNELKTGKPVQYILGCTEFFGLKLRVTPDVLIPRPETEELVKWIIDDFSRKPVSILDIGTGSGCIAIALKKFLKNSNIHGCDISVPALEIAHENARSNSVEVLFYHLDISAILTSKPGEIIHNDIFWSSKTRNKGNHNSMEITDSDQIDIKTNHGLNKLHDLIVSNPPYIPLSEKSSININVTGFEPGIALFVPDDDPLLFYRHIALFGSDHLKKNGQIYLEIHENSGPSVKKLLEEHGYRQVTIRSDINGKDRMIKCFKYG
jgi:release factor glutamine methyltransferase